MDADRLAGIVERFRGTGRDALHHEVMESVGAPPSSIPETLSAFSNGEGGVLILGLSEQHGFALASGFNVAAMRDALTAACEKMTPPVRPDVDLVPFEGGTALVAEVSPLAQEEKPCYVTARGLYQGPYIRTADGDRLLTAYEVDRLVEARRQPRWDARVVGEASMADLNGNLVRRVIDRQMELHPAVFSGMAREEILENLRIAARTGDGSLKPTLAGLLSLGKYPQKFFPRLLVSFASYPESEAGEGGSLRILDSRNCVGPIPQMVADALQAVMKNSGCGAMIGEGLRKDVWDYPLIAVREAVANALQHRDYSPAGASSPVSILMYPDRLEIISPGGLYGNATTEDLGQPGVTASRNQFLSSILETTPCSGGRMVVENRGSGIPAIRKSLEASQMYPAEMASTLSAFRITFLKRRQEKKAVSGDELERLILKELSARSALSVREVTALSGLSRSTVNKRLRRLVLEGRIEPMEPGNSPRQKYRLTGQQPARCR